MAGDTLHLGSIGWLDHRDEILIQSVVLMSKNGNEVLYPIVDATHTFQTPPLEFDFFDRPIVFRFNQEGPDLFNNIKNNILARSEGILFSLGGSGVDLDYLYNPKKQGDIQYLKTLIGIVKQSTLPTLYALNGNI